MRKAKSRGAKFKPLGSPKIEFRTKGIRPKGSMPLTLKEKTVKARVYKILEEHLSARNNYTVLLWIYARKYSGIAIPFTPFSKMLEFSSESITRAARHIQNTRGLFPPSDKAMRGRGRKWQRMRDEYAPQ